MATETQHIKLSYSPQEREDHRAQFKGSMVIVRHRVRTADKDEAEYYFSLLVEEAKFLARKFGYKLVP